MSCGRSLPLSLSLSHVSMSLVPATQFRYFFILFQMWNRVIDRPNGGYSSLDVDAVDFTKFPDLAKVRYARVDMEAGDCLYIPYRW